MLFGGAFRRHGDSLHVDETYELFSPSMPSENQSLALDWNHYSVLRPS